MYPDREMCFVFKKSQQNLNTGVLGDPIRTGYGQFNGRPIYLFIASEGEVTATGDPTLELALEYADNEDFDDAVEIALPGVWKKADLYGKGGRPCPCVRVPMSPLRWSEPKDVYYRLKITASSEFACTGDLTAGFSLDPQTNW